MKESSRLMAKRMEEHLRVLEQLQLTEYLRYVQDTRRLMRTQFVSGLFRGMGMAVGFTILGAVLVVLLQALAQRNLPVIGDFLAQIVAIVQSRLE
ncbi:MAG: DUF5665 domain-containing protein [Eubacteriales bacterium]|nr:DUF5665 domain-containing protein [Eubacteriales bacterium]